jgi:phage I-like protein
MGFAAAVNPKQSNQNCKEQITQLLQVRSMIIIAAAELGQTKGTAGISMKSIEQTQ